MLKSLGFLALWLVGTAIAVAVAWAGVAVVDSELVNPAPANTLALRQTDDEMLGSAATVPVGSMDGVPEAVPAPASSTTIAPATTASSTASSSTASTSTTSTSTTAAPATASTATSTTTAPATTSTTTTSPTTTSTTTTSTTTTTPTTTTSPTTTTTTAVPSQTLTFHLVGGSTAIAFSPAGATVLWASPNPGFDVDIDHGAESRVEFESDDHKTRIDAWWSGGPQHEIREDAD